MSFFEALYASGMIGVEIAVPVLRFISSVFLAFAISVDSKARNRSNGALWGFLVLLSPVFMGILYFIYSRFLSDRRSERADDKRLNIKSRVLCIFSFLTYFTMVVVLVISVVIAVSSGVLGTIKGDFEVDNNPVVASYDKEKIGGFETAEITLIFD